MKPLIGILAIQGSVREHSEILKDIANTKEVKNKRDFTNLDALIIPGGESTTIIKLLKQYSLDEEILNFNKPIYGTCAGAIILARKVTNPEQESLSLIDIEIERNGYGRQFASFEQKVYIKGLENFNAIFIRAPIIISTGKNVEILSYCNSNPVMCQQNNVLVSTFHSELTNDSRIHKYFLEMI